MLKFLKSIKTGKYNTNLDDLIDFALCTKEDIENLLKIDFKFYQIADNIPKHPTTISKEILNNRTEHKPSNFNNKSNCCEHKILAHYKISVVPIVIHIVDVVENVIPFVHNMN